MFSGIVSLRFGIGRAAGGGGGAFAKTAMVVLAVIFAVLFSLSAADNAAAQQTTVRYSAQPGALVSVGAKGEVIVLSQPAAGVMTATIEAVGLTLIGGEYVKDGATRRSIPPPTGWTTRWGGLCRE